jgi:hypothetical protein
VTAAFMTDASKRVVDVQPSGREGVQTRHICIHRGGSNFITD